jgi:hypothetical protein
VIGERLERRIGPDLADLSHGQPRDPVAGARRKLQKILQRDPVCAADRQAGGVTDCACLRMGCASQESRTAKYAFGFVDVR